ncbi:hypothetical protein [Nitrolancea hollandica]|nr:hypothetical protein [Nitrolancea hollandica]
MIDVQSQADDMVVMAGTTGMNEDHYRLAKRTSHADPAKAGLNNLWLRRRAEYTALHRSGVSRMSNPCLEHGVQ